MFKYLLVFLALIAFGAAVPEARRITAKIVPTGKSNAIESSEENNVGVIVNESAEEDSDAAAVDNDADANVPLSTTAAPAQLTVNRASSASSILFGQSPILLSSVLTGPTRIQHQVLPAETIPLPITITTRAGLRTVLQPETITVHRPTVAKVGEVVQNIPTAVSHQRQTIVHNHARVVTPIVAPAVRTISTQVLRAIHTPLILAPQISTINNKSA